MLTAGVEFVKSGVSVRDLFTAAVATDETLTKSGARLSVEDEGPESG
jgi:hypothetical protein